VALRSAFSLLELIFVIAIIGILAAIGAYYYRPNTLQKDTDFVLGKIKEARFRGIGFNKLYAENGSQIENWRSVGCIELTKEGIENAFIKKDEAKKYRLNSHTIIESVYYNGYEVDTLCFDYLGRPHRDRNDNGDLDNNETRLDTLLHTPLKIKLSYNDKLKTILILPISGFATTVVDD